MIDGEAIARAERILQVTYREQDTPRQLRDQEVEMEAFNPWLQARLEIVQKNYTASYRKMDPRLQSAYNTLLMHMFLVGLIVGRGERQVIE